MGSEADLIVPKDRTGDLRDPCFVDPRNGDRIFIPDAGGQQDFIDDWNREAVVSSDKGGGKTTLICDKALIFASEFAGSRNVLFRKHRDSALLNTAPELRRLLGSERFYAGWYKGDAMWVDPVTEAQIVFGGMDNISKWAGGQLAFAGCDEIVKPIGGHPSDDITEENWLDVAALLRDPHAPIQQIVGGTNPGPPDHWVLKRWRAGKLSLHKLKPGANAHRLPKAYRDWMASLTGVFFKRYVLGEWVSAEGMVFVPPWDEAIHCRRPPDGDFAQRGDLGIQLWIDFGYAKGHAFACLFARTATVTAEDYGWCVFGEVHGYQRTVSDWASVIDKLVERNRWHVSKIITDHNPEGIENLKRHLRCAQSARWELADKTVGVGIQTVLEYMAVRPDGLPRLWVSPECKVLRREISILPWDGKRDRPLKQQGIDDDCADALRYGINTNEHGSIVKSTDGFIEGEESILLGESLL